MKMQEAINYMHDHATDVLTKAKKIGYICPLCGSGTGAKGTGLTITKDGKSLHCWACGFNGDIIDLIASQRGITDGKSKEAIDAAAAEFNITIDGKESGYNPQPKPRAKQQEAEPPADYTDFFIQANKDIDKTDYHRGISLDTLNRFKIGYVAEWKHPKSPNAHPSPRLIIPTGRGSYNARYVGEVPPTAHKYEKVGTSRLFNVAALTEATAPIFILEGELDALSVIDAGGAAVGLASTSGVPKFLEAVKQKRADIKQPFILCLDNDKAGADAQASLESGLKELYLPYIKANIAGQYKDANEALNAEKTEFSARIVKASQEAAEVYEAWRDRAKNELKGQSVAYSLKNYLAEIEARQDAPIATGFNFLDKVLDGGLTAGLYVIGAVSSLGKTSFCLQIADHIAQSGRDVLYFSLEMAKRELMAKTISRLTYTEGGQNAETARTTHHILTGSKYKYYSAESRALMEKAVDKYSEFADHLYITDGIGSISVKKIEQTITHHIDITGEPPIVFIDYLQILTPADPTAHLTDKQNIDQAITALKVLSVNHNVPIVAISSFNRASYTEPVGMASSKESGAVEYSADVLIGLQYWGMEYKGIESEQAHKQRVYKLMQDAEKAAKNGEAQNIQVKILKNRNGRKSSNIYLNFTPPFNYFEDTDGALWRSADGEGVQTDTPKKSKREQKAEKLEQAFLDVASDSTGAADLGELANALNLTSKTAAKRLIQDLGGYTVKGETVTKDAEDVQVFFGSNITEDEDLPF